MKRSLSYLTLTLMSIPLVGLGLGCGETTLLTSNDKTDDGLSTYSGGSIPGMCSIRVDGIGTVDMEEDYLPHLLACEHYSGSFEALKALAVAARTYGYRVTRGPDENGVSRNSICNSTMCQVAYCNKPPIDIHYQAVRETKGEVLAQNGVVVMGNYKAGENECYEGHWRQGYGDMGQNNATCLADKGMDYRNILWWFYGGVDIVKTHCMRAGETCEDNGKMIYQQSDGALNAYFGGQCVGCALYRDVWCTGCDCNALNYSDTVYHDSCRTADYCPIEELFRAWRPGDICENGKTLYDVGGGKVDAYYGPQCVGCGLYRDAWCNGCDCTNLHYSDTIQHDSCATPEMCEYGGWYGY